MSQYPIEEENKRQGKLPSLPKTGEVKRRFDVLITTPRLALPHEVILRIFQRTNSIIAEYRRDRAQRRAQTRKQRASK